MTKLFSRYAAASDRTFALRWFNKAETEINEHFWSFQVVSDRSAFLARNAKASNPRMATAKVFSASGPDAARIPATVTDWLSARTELENWLRTSALISASAYLESYLRQVVRSALMSDPMRRFGAARSLDGVALLKQGKEVPYEFDIRSITSGDWPARSEAFRRMFGSVPKALTDNISDLETIRRLRNDYAHGFGRSLDVPPPSHSGYDKAQRLSRVTLLKYFGMMSKVAAGVDKVLLGQVIGNFELIHFFHEWRSKPNIGRNMLQSEAKRLKSALNKDGNASVNVQFAEDLITYYMSV